MVLNNKKELKSETTDDSGNGNNGNGRKEIHTTVPTIYEHQLVPSMPSTQRGIRGISIYDSYIIAITGPRGGIKSGTLAYCCMKFLAAGLPVFTNQPVEFNIIRRDGTHELLKSQDLELDKLFTHSDEYHGGLVAIDEYQLYDRSSRSMTTQHLVLMGQWEQIRKLDMSFYYVAKRIELVPGDIAWETDIEINCSDITPYPKSGEVCLWNIKDLSGLWTRRMFDPKNPMYYKERFYHRAIWGAYGTKQKFDFFEAMRGVKMDMQKRVISDKQGRNIDYEELKRKTVAVFDSVDRIKPMDLYEAIGVPVDNPHAQRIVKRYLTDELGLESKNRWYRLARV